MLRKKSNKTPKQAHPKKEGFGRDLRECTKKAEEAGFAGNMGVLSLPGTLLSQKSPVLDAATQAAQGGVGRVGGGCG